MSNELNTNEVVEETTVNETKSEKKANKKSFKDVMNSVKEFFKRIWKKIVKLCKDTKSEMKKVAWTSKTELKKSTKLVLASIVAVGLAIAVIDVACSYLINTIAGLIG